MTTTYTLQVQLDTTELIALKNSDYSLCIAKKVDNVYNVVWQRVSILQNNTFQWTEDYAVFGQDNFTSGGLVRADTSIQPLALGESIDLDINGVFQNLGGSPGGSSLTINNNYKAINFGVQAALNGIISPIYLDTTPALVGTETLTPMPSILVWFDRILPTSTMFTSAVTRSVEVDYTGITSQTVSYVSDPTTGAGAWIFGSPASNQELQYVPHKLYHPLTRKFEDLPFANDYNAVRNLIDQRLSFSLKRPMSMRSPPQFLIQATVTFPPTGDLEEVVSFLKENLPREIEVDFKIPAVQGFTGKIMTVKLAWNTSVPPKSPTARYNNANMLEKIFSRTLKLYGLRYTSEKFVSLI